MYSSADINDLNWYVVRTKPKQEFRALENLENQRHVCFMPTIKVEKTRCGKLHSHVEPLFSRYLFMQLSTAESWTAIRSTRGVSNLVSFGGRYATLSNECIDALRNAQMLVQPIYEPGEKVIITTGPFIGFEGVYQMMDGDARALVLIELLSRPQKLPIALEALKKAA